VLFIRRDVDVVSVFTCHSVTAAVTCSNVILYSAKYAHEWLLSHAEELTSVMEQIQKIKKLRNACCVPRENDVGLQHQLTWSLILYVS